MLESAGFSKSNPYYFVQQGKVAALCAMNDGERLQLLKEVAGTTVYEERRNESLKILQETTVKMDQIKVRAFFTLSLIYVTFFFHFVSLGCHEISGRPII